MDEIREFLSDPDKNEDEFWESDALIWVDWGDEDESVIKYFKDELPEKDKIRFECADSDKERGVDIILEKDGVKRPIPYEDDCTDRDTTLKSVQEYLSPDYQIRWYMGSLGGDTLAFCILTASQWNELEREFGAEKVAYYFAPVREDSRMFDLDADEVCDWLEQREKA